MTAITDAKCWEKDVFQSRGDEPPYHRIPALLVSGKETLLAFCEARHNRNGDHAENDILLRRSIDGGRTWGPVQTVATDGTNSLNNPTVVEVRETGRILLMYQRYPCGYHVSADPKWNLGGVEPGYDGDRICRTFMRTSDDDGVTWSAPVEITRSVKRSETARATLAGPGIGIQMRREPYQGRIVMPFYEGPAPYRVYSVISDDLGATWTCGATADDASDGNGNENQVVELTDGSILVNSRHYGGAPCRKTAVSRDGGATWSGLRDEPALIGPGCQGSILRYSDPLDGRRSRIVFSNPASARERKQGTVRLSYDEGQTWPVAKIICGEGFFCYSCLAVLPDGSIGCLYERTLSDDRPLNITFQCFTIDWLTDGQDTGTP